MKIFEVSYACDKYNSRNSLSNIKSLKNNYQILSNICRSSINNKHPMLLKIVMEKFQRYKAETGKSSKTKINSPNKTKQINIPLNHNKINFIRENIENLSISEIRSEISLVKVRKFAKTRLNISFESEVHNIYDPKYSSTQSSFVDQQSEVESFISTITLNEKQILSKEVNKEATIRTLRERNSPIPEIKFDAVPYKNDPIKILTHENLSQILLRHNSNKSKDNFDSSLELCLKSEDCQTNRNSYSKYLSVSNKPYLKNEMKYTIASIYSENNDNFI